MLQYLLAHGPRWPPLRIRKYLSSHRGGASPAAAAASGQITGDAPPEIGPIRLTSLLRVRKVGPPDTQGLDSTSSLAVALSLKKMCQLGMTSIMVIHQPRYSLFTLFDDVLLLGKGGQTVYLGPSLRAKASGVRKQPGAWQTRRC